MASIVHSDDLLVHAPTVSNTTVHNTDHKSISVETSPMQTDNDILKQNAGEEMRVHAEAIHEPNSTETFNNTTALSKTPRADQTQTVFGPNKQQYNNSAIKI